MFVGFGTRKPFVSDLSPRPQLRQHSAGLLYRLLFLESSCRCGSPQVVLFTSIFHTLKKWLFQIIVTCTSVSSSSLKWLKWETQAASKVITHSQWLLNLMPRQDRCEYLWTSGCNFQMLTSLGLTSGVAESSLRQSAPCNISPMCSVSLKTWLTLLACNSELFPYAGILTTDKSVITVDTSYLEK